MKFGFFWFEYSLFRSSEYQWDQSLFHYLYLAVEDFSLFESPSKREVFSANVLWLLTTQEVLI